MEKFSIALRSILYMSGFVYLWGWVAVTIRPFDREISISLPPGTKLLGIVLMVAGGVLALTCAGNFVFRGRGTPAPFDSPRQLVAFGPYKVVRNPMYIGGLTLLVGFGLYLNSISILFLALALFVLAHLFVVFYEEPDLKVRFGPPYQAYCKEVPRWTPRWRSRAFPHSGKADSGSAEYPRSGN